MKDVLIVKAVPRNLTKVDKIEDVMWFDSKIFIKDCLSSIVKDSDSDKNILAESEYIIIGSDKDEFSYIKNLNVETFDFEFCGNSDYKKLSSKFKSRSVIYDKVDIEYKFNNKYDVVGMFLEKYKDIYKSLHNRYDAIERGGNMIDFRGNNIIFSEWDFHDDSGSEGVLTTIDELISSDVS